MNAADSLYEDDVLTVIQGDCVDVLREMPEASVDAVVTDPPYGIGFMGREWDTFSPARLNELDSRRQLKGTTRISERWPTKVGKISQGGGPSVEYDFSSSGAHRFQSWSESWSREALRVLRPGGHMLAFCGTRMFHRMTCAIEDAGFEIRDCLMWLYGSGFPKSLDVSKQFDKRAGATREKIGEGRGGAALKLAGQNDRPWHAKQVARGGTYDYTSPTTDLARKWDGWGTALKPAWEPIILARKPLDGTVAENVEKHGTGALNIDGSRIGTEGEVIHAPQSDPTKRAGTVGKDLGITRANVEDFQVAQRASIEKANALGRWPANVLLDEEAAAMLDEQVGERPSGKMYAFHRNGPQRKVYGRDALAGYQVAETYGDTGGASRFFYVAKASRADRGKENTHPTVKPVELMRYLVRLVTPPGGLVLDPFAGSGTTGQAALAEGLRCVLIEKEAEYVEGIRAWRGAMQTGHGL